jgi:hypothetical protein
MDKFIQILPIIAIVVVPVRVIMTAEKTRTLPLSPILNTNFPLGRHCVAGRGKEEGLMGGKTFQSRRFL